MTHDELVALLSMLMYRDVELVKITDLDIIYNPNMNGGEWEVFDSYSDHTEYSAYDDINELAELILEYI